MKRIKYAVLSILVVSLLLVTVSSGAFAASDSAESGTAISETENYSDIQNSWFEIWAAQYGYEEIFSSGDGCFHPTQAVTRMELARLLHRALDININYFAPTDIGDYFDDVTNSDVGANDLYDLVTCSIIDTKGSFDPAGELDRDEMIHFIMNAFYYSAGYDYAVPDLTTEPFSDNSGIKAAYLADVSRSVTLGLINGTGSHYLQPRSAATRAEAVTAVGRLAELLQKCKTDVTVKAAAHEADGALLLTLTIANNTGDTVAINHSDGQKFDFVIEDNSGNELYHRSEGMSFTMMLETTEIAPSGEIAFSDTMDAETYASIKDQIASVKAYIAGTSPDFEICAEGYLISGIY